MSNGQVARAISSLLDHSGNILFARPYATIVMVVDGRGVQRDRVLRETIMPIATRRAVSNSTKQKAIFDCAIEAGGEGKQKLGRRWKETKKRMKNLERRRKQEVEIQEGFRQ